MNLNLGYYWTKEFLRENWDSGPIIKDWEREEGRLIDQNKTYDQLDKMVMERFADQFNPTYEDTVTWYLDKGSLNWKKDREIDKGELEELKNKAIGEIYGDWTNMDIVPVFSE